MTTALHLVPEPDDEHTPPSDTAGEQQPTEAAPATVEAELEDEEPAPLQALAMPDLRPYVSLEWIPAVINAGLEATRRWRKQAPERKAARRARKKERRAAGEPTGRRRLWAMAADYLAGTRFLLGHLAAWLGGEYGPKDMKTPARLAALGFAGYCAVRTVTTWPVWGPVGITVVWCCAALGALHRQRAEQGDKQPTGKAAKALAKTAEQTPAEGPVEDTGDSPDEDPEEAPAEAAAEPAAPPSREAIAGALHHLVGEGRGVLLTTLRQHLSLPHTRALREVLDAAGIRVRPGVRTPAGNGPGIHTNDFPPPPPSPDPAHGDRCLPRSGANNNNANAERSPQKGLRADGSYWPEGKPYHLEPDASNPHRTLIVYHRDEQ
ncbi:hypothetical protein ACFU93_32410 [Streptomyces sp. NPDC057611]|uniref:hypothetical protein n=1 Tax=Streptomyces sp. NPDC057611 TaxID=3346182 RepID=UPI0036A16683